MFSDWWPDAFTFHDDKWLNWVHCRNQSFLWYDTYIFVFLQVVVETSVTFCQCYDSWRCVKFLISPQHLLARKTCFFGLLFCLLRSQLIVYIEIVYRPFICVRTFDRMRFDIWFIILNFTLTFIEADVPFLDNVKYLVLILRFCFLFLFKIIFGF